jgi:hypothetical protein
MMSTVSMVRLDSVVTVILIHTCMVCDATAALVLHNECINNDALLCRC